jgi:hypothetical protein
MSIAEAIVRGVLKIGQAIVDRAGGKPAAKQKLDPPIIELESERVARAAAQRRNAGSKPSGD